MKKRDRTEELTIVFTLEEASDSEELALGANTVRLQPRIGSIAALDALNLLIACMHVLGIEAAFTEGQKTISASTLLQRVEKKGTWGHVETAGLSFQYGVAGSYEHCFISIREKVANAAARWEEWAMRFIAVGGFVEGWVVDVEYNHWQNAKDPLEYQVAGRDFSQLPMKSNGLPSPLAKMEIDISRNPGRWVLRRGYVEAVGALMWLSNLFWDRTGRDRIDAVNSTGWLRASEPSKGIVEIRAAEYCFISDDTADVQNRLRNILYV